jgi:hypothetical protein
VDPLPRHRPIAGPADELGPPVEDRNRRFGIDADLVARLAQALLATVLGLLILREAVVGVVTLRRRATRVATTWWDDVQRHEQQAARHAQIGVVAGRIRRR